MANITEIARQAKVSRSTVSRVLNDHPYVTVQKKEAVLEAIRSLDYVPNRNAINLSKGKTNIIGVMVPQINHPFFNNLISGMGEACSRLNLSLLVTPTNNDFEKEKVSFDQLRYKQIDGLVIASTVSSAEFLAEVNRHGPIVSCEWSEGSHSQVYIDHSNGIELIMNHLIERSYEKIALCLGNPDSGVGKSRKNAFYEFVDKSKIIHLKEWYFEKKYSFEDGRAVMNDLYGLSALPRAIVVGNDYVAAGIIHQAKLLNVKVPEDLAVTGFDNQSISEAMGITTIDQPIHQLGIEVIKTIDSLINGQHKNVGNTLPLQLISRQST
ncbi:LacI family DNA-binding transcriptional regulator [Exiguobacterium undae]|uniref:LacI family transcriptional regulator n=1 Tax=Exiguobacterium undae TaxID=169177 RepID=A0ABX2V4W9_9BACL|nr:LacI family DNA-binding transcriptional regulator [Exiguobacterium undae]OAN10120.1 LacI family transcriptional regulator [Exiguobacterium undae]